LEKKSAFLVRNSASFCKNWIITLVFKNATFSAENGLKLLKMGKSRRKPPKIAENTDQDIGPSTDG
jgi:hypothetical protein